MAGRNSPIKKRSQNAYQKKVRRITAWYNRLLELRKKPVQENKDNDCSYYKRIWYKFWIKGE